MIRKEFVMLNVREPIGGWPRKGYTREMPASLAHPERGVRVGEESDFLPTSLLLRGCMLMQMEEEKRDPWVLYDEWGRILAEWLKPPSLGQLMDFCGES